MTAFGDLQTAVKAVHAEAFEYVTKPFDLESMLQSVKRALNQNKAESKSEDQASEPVQSNLLIGVSSVMQTVFKRIAIAAKTDMPVLIEGERGTGKDLVAAMIHRFSARCNEHSCLPHPSPRKRTNLNRNCLVRYPTTNRLPSF